MPTSPSVVLEVTHFQWSLKGEQKDWAHLEKILIQGQPSLVVSAACEHIVCKEPMMDEDGEFKIQMGRHISWSFISTCLSLELFLCDNSSVLMSKSQLLASCSLCLI